jgi:hypothetical protein
MYSGSRDIPTLISVFLPFHVERWHSIIPAKTSA